MRTLPAGQRAGGEPVDPPEKRGKRLARARRSADHGHARPRRSPATRAPAPRWACRPRREPLRNEGVEQRKARPRSCGHSVGRSAAPSRARPSRPRAAARVKVWRRASSRARGIRWSIGEWGSRYFSSPGSFGSESLMRSRASRESGRVDARPGQQLHGKRVCPVLGFPAVVHVHHGLRERPGRGSSASAPGQHALISAAIPTRRASSVSGSRLTRVRQLVAEHARHLLRRVAARGSAPCRRRSCPREE